AALDADLIRRQGGYGRGARMRMEQDRAEVLSGIRHGLTLGSPVTLHIMNKDWVNWQERMSVAPIAEPTEAVTQVRPGHADFTGALKYHQADVRNIIERSSSRETAARVAVGGVCRQLLAQFGIAIHSHVLSIGTVGAPDAPRDLTSAAWDADFWERVAASPVRCADPGLSDAMIEFIKATGKAGDTAGGVFEVVATGVPAGLGSYSQWDRRLGARLALALMSIPSAKGVELGAGFGAARRLGSQIHDVLRHATDGAWSHLTNNAGGMEGGISNGEPVVARVALKPIPTLAHPLPSVDLATGVNIDATRYERSDVCVVPAGGVVGEAMVAITLAEVLLETYGGDSLPEVRAHYEATQALQAEIGVPSADTTKPE
ncbi:MAG: chorismate synthase, partial [Ktedonobacterales bacterium]|nr:chorismate synthase [Ktedonobacterales bacterium]